MESLESIETEIWRVLKKLCPERSCVALAREATSELSQAELSKLSTPQREKWDRLSASTRRLEWSQARRCEWELHEKLGPTARISLSHTLRADRPFVFAAGAVFEAPLGRVGIDVELSSRAVSEAVADRYIHAGERQLGLEPLEIWVIKEALFKADPENAGTTLPAHEITDFDPATRMGIGKISSRSERFAILKFEDWVVAIAVSQPVS